MKRMFIKNQNVRRALCLTLCAALLSLNGCAPKKAEESAPEVSETPVLIHASVTPAPVLDNEPAIVYTNVLTDQRVISLVLEGYTDDSTMGSVLDTLREENVPCVYFISGIVANEHPAMVKAIADAGFTVGNYSLDAEKSMEENDVLTNIHQFERAQELIRDVTGISPTLFRCNGSVYTRELLQAAAHTGLQAGVQPNAFLNHSSFKEYDDALLFVQKLARGSILSVKLGQALDSDEYSGTTYSNKDIAVDPEPFLSDNMDDTIAAEYANIVNVVPWLLKALDEEGYAVVTPEALQAEKITLFDNPRELDEKTLALLDPDAYTFPVTDQPLDSGMAALLTASTAAETPAPASGAENTETSEPEATADGTGEANAAKNGFPAGTVFVGDSVTAGLQNYVEWKRGTDPGYLNTVQFLTSTNFGVGMSLMRISADSVQPEVNGVKMDVENALYALNAKTAVLMPGQSDARAYTTQQLTDNLKLMIYQIRKKNPGIAIWLQTIPPGMAERYTKPDNTQIFRCNLAISKLCLQYDIPLIDVAYTLRDGQGNLSEELCVDPDTYGIHLNDAGCEKWISYLRGRMSD